MIATALLTSVVALTEPEPEPEPDPPAERETIAGGWLQIAPLGLAVPGPGASEDLRTLDAAVAAGFRWGFAAGITIEPVPHLLISLAGAADQTIWIFDNSNPSYRLCFGGACHGWTERGLGQLVRVGPELRLGLASRYVLAWGLFAAHVGLGRIRLDCNNSVEEHCDRSETDVGPGLGGGLGLAARLVPSFALGLETSIDHTWLDNRHDPFEAARTWDLALIAIVRF